MALYVQSSGGKWHTQDLNLHSIVTIVLTGYKLCADLYGSNMIHNLFFYTFRYIYCGKATSIEERTLLLNQQLGIVHDT